MNRETIIAGYLIIAGIALAPWALACFLSGIRAAWDGIDILKRYIRGY